MEETDRIIRPMGFSIYGLATQRRRPVAGDPGKSRRWGRGICLFLGFMVPNETGFRGNFVHFRAYVSL